VLEEALVIANKHLEQLTLARELIRRGDCRDPNLSQVAGAGRAVPVAPAVTVPLGAKLLKVRPKAVDLMLAQLGGALPRELTGRTRYRAWGIV
jgi:HTH DNA binding domain